MNWYQKATNAVLEELNVKLENGLSQIEAHDKLQTFGPNVLASGKKETLFDIFIRQFKSPLIYILIFAAALTLLLKQSIDSLVILSVITINAIVGTIQEGKARNSLERLKSLTVPKAQVRRNGQETIISSDDVVPGDILILREGSKVPADARIINAQGFKVDESVLTGEASVVSKSSDAIRKQDLIVGDQKNMVFAGTNVVAGYAEAIVIATGFDSELGKISKSLLETSSVPLPLAQKILKLTHQVSLAVFLIAASIFLIGIIQGIQFKEIIAAVIGLSVSIVPEGLPVAVTVVLAKGVWRMAKSHAIVRHMVAVEAMGNADILMVDKTGTITTGNMLARGIFYNDQYFQVSGQGYNPEGEITRKSFQKLPKNLEKFLGFCYLSLKADVIKDEKEGWKPVGDPTEVALAVLCRKAGLSKEKLSKSYETILAQPFDSKKRYIEASFKKSQEKWQVFVGAPEFLSRDLRINHNISNKYQELARLGQRVIGAVVFGPSKNKLFAHALFVIDEEIRESVKDSIAESQKAGFKVIMITGDFAETAKAIAQKVGIFHKDDEVLTGVDIESLSHEELADHLDKVSVFARITPNHKLKIVNIFKKNGHVVAMTGDGVNDGPALQAADLGIGFGSGTQVAKDASDIVLIDNNFSTIVKAISEGRAIYLTLKKVILYLFSTSLGEVLVIGGSLLLGLPLPLVAVQIIWLNFVTDGFLVVALAQDPPEKGLLSQSEVKSSSLLDSSMIRRSLLMGTSMFVATLPFFYAFESTSLTYSRTVALLILSITQWFNALNIRSEYHSIFKTPLTNNWYLISAIFIVVSLQYFAIQTPFGNNLLHTTPLSLAEWLLAITVSSLIIVIEEIRKYFARKPKWVSFGKIN